MDEYGTKIVCSPTESTEPLSLRELIGLMDTAQYDNSPEFVGLTNAFRDYDAGSDPEELLAFVSVSSEFYSELESYYDDDGQRWLEERRRSETSG